MEFMVKTETLTWINVCDSVAMYIGFWHLKINPKAFQMSSNPCGCQTTKRIFRWRHQRVIVQLYWHSCWKYYECWQLLTKYCTKRATIHNLALYFLTVNFTYNYTYQLWPERTIWLDQLVWETWNDTSLEFALNLSWGDAMSYRYDRETNGDRCTPLHIHYGVFLTSQWIRNSRIRPWRPVSINQSVIPFRVDGCVIARKCLGLFFSSSCHRTVLVRRNAIPGAERAATDPSQCCHPHIVYITLLL